MDCENLAKCKFFTFISATKAGQTAAKGFELKYCKGEDSDSCVRKKVSKALGGPQNVPDNMMPNGYPLAGTSTALWSDTVKTLVSEVVASLPI
jgi:hypothetical protein